MATHARPRRLRVGAALAALAVLAACGGGGRDPLEIGIKRIALDLAFKDESKADPVPPAKIIEVIGADPALLDDIVLQEPDRIVRGRTGPVLPPAAPPCGVAGPDVFPKKPVTVLFQGAPKPGIYSLHNGGTIKIGSGALRFSLPFPTVSTYEIKNVVVTPGIPPDFPEPARSLADPGDTVTYDLVKQIGLLTVTDSYRNTRSELALTKRVTVAKSLTGTATSTNTFTPTPAVVLAAMAQGDGDTWSSAGTDRDTNTGMVVQGAVERNEYVDLCGEKYDSWRVRSTEQTVNLTTNEQSQTDPQAPNIYHFANHMGGLMIQEEGHYTQTIIIDRSPVTLEYDFVSTFDSVEPRIKK